MPLGNLYQLKTWLERESDALTVSRWALWASPQVGADGVKLGQVSPGDEVDEATFNRLRAEAERLAGKPFGSSATPVG